jgi:hypothetical protein
LGAIQLDSDEEEGSGSESEACERRSDIISSPPRSVVSIDSIAENADFVSFGELA